MRLASRSLPIVRSMTLTFLGRKAGETRGRTSAPNRYGLHHSGPSERATRRVGKEPAASTESRRMIASSSTRLFETITNRIIAAIEAGAPEYRMPWIRSGEQLHQPINALTKRPYRGINVLLLWLTAEGEGYRTGRWGTYRQWREVGYQVRKGERSTPVLLWKEVPRAGGSRSEDEGLGEPAARLLARAFHVFNADQVDGESLPNESPLPAGEATRAAENFFSSIPAKVQHGGDRASYIPAADKIQVPYREQFRSIGAYYSVLAHELTHWTGAKHRLNRDLSMRFGSERYAMEELIAELGSAFLGADLKLGMEPRRDHAPYIASWLTVLRNDPRAIVTAASKAQAAVDYLFAVADGSSEAEPQPDA